MIDMRMFVGADPLSVGGLFLALLIIALGAAYVYADLDKKPLFSPVKALCFLLGYLFLLAEVVGFWSWPDIIFLYWMGFFLMSLPFAIDLPMRLTLSFSLVVIFVDLTLFLDHYLTFLLPPTFWVANPLAVPPLLYLAREGTVGFFIFFWGWIWRKNDLAMSTLGQQISLFLGLVAVLFVNIGTYRQVFVLNRETYSLVLLFSLSLLLLVLLF